LGGIGRFLYYHSSQKQWYLSIRENMEADDGKASPCVNITADFADQINEQWQVDNGTAWHNAPNLRVRVCSSVEKHAAEQLLLRDRTKATKDLLESA
jgi:hypothetical protein